MNHYSEGIYIWYQKVNFEIPHSLSANMCPLGCIHESLLEELCYIGCQRLNICDSGDIVAKQLGCIQDSR